MVALDHRHGTGTLFFRVRGEAAGAGVHTGDQGEVSRVGQRAGRAADGDDLIRRVQRLAQHLQHTGAEFGQFVQEEHAPVGQADLAGLGPAPAADVCPAAAGSGYQAGVADDMVGGTKGSVADQGLVGGKLVGHGVDAGHFKGFIDAHFGQDARHRAGDEGFARPGRARHKQVVAAGGGDF